MNWKVFPERLVSLAFLVLGILVIKFSLEFGYPLSGPIEFNPGIYPVLLGILLIVLACISVLLGIWRKGEVLKATGQAGGIGGKFTLTAVMVVISAIVYTLFLPFVGYIIATPLWMVSILLIIREKVKARLVILFCGLVVLTYLAFWKFLPVRLPVGVFFE